MELYEALIKAFDECGKDIIKTNVVVNVLSDFHAFSNKATRRIMQTFIQLGFGESIYNIMHDDAPDKLLKLQVYEKELVNQGFQESQVSYVMNSLLYALGWINLPPTPIDTNSNFDWSSQNIDLQVGDCNFKMIFVRGSSFDMGGTPEQGLFAAFDEKPSREVILDDYYIGETVVTQKLWKNVMTDNPSHFIGDNRPVERVSWDECGAFLNILNARLNLHFRFPTEAEWEYAARGGICMMGNKYAGADDDSIKDYVWFKENSEGCTHDVKTRMPNELGLYDMSGNISEWCGDWYFNSYANCGTKENPSGPSVGNARVYRGGSWNDKAIACRTSKRSFMNPTYRNKQVGLRLVMSNKK